MPLELEKITEKDLHIIHQVLCATLLYERQEETELRVAFHSLVQERHNHFHDKEGEDTEFTSCGNLICINALKMLQSARKPKVVVNAHSIQAIAPYRLMVDRVGDTCEGYLVEINPENIPQETENTTKKGIELKV